MDEHADRAESGTEAGAGAGRESSPIWGVIVLAVIALLAAVDRQAFSVLLVPIQKTLHVGDAAMGALAGSAFILVYAVVALPLARLADRTNRRNLLAIAVGVWSLATALCGLASSFLPLMVARVVVGTAESVQTPATNSMIGDMFAPNRRGMAIGIVIVGSASGYALGSALAGLLSDLYGWHMALALVGLPGLLVAFLLFATVAEPHRGRHDGGPTPSTQSVIQCLRVAARIRTLYYFVPAYVLQQICFVGWLTWAPAFLMRVHHMSATRMGAVFGAVVAAATVAAIAGGLITDRLARRGARWRLYYCVIVIVVAAPILSLSSLVDSWPLTFGLMLAYTIVSGGLTTVAITVYISLCPSTMRGFMTALMNLFAAILGAGTAPLIYGLVNDWLKPSYGDEALRYTLQIGPLSLVAAAILYLLAARYFERDVAAVAG